MVREEEFLMQYKEYGDIRVEMLVVTCKPCPPSGSQGVEFVVNLKFRGENFKQWGRWKIDDAMEIYYAMAGVFELLERVAKE